VVLHHEFPHVSDSRTLSGTSSHRAHTGTSCSYRREWEDEPWACPFDWIPSHKLHIWSSVG
jgi:hypothetical protein